MGLYGHVPQTSRDVLQILGFPCTVLCWNIERLRDVKNESFPEPLTRQQVNVAVNSGHNSCTTTHPLSWASISIPFGGSYPSYCKLCTASTVEVSFTLNNSSTSMVCLWNTLSLTIAYLYVDIDIITYVRFILEILSTKVTCVLFYLNMLIHFFSSRCSALLPFTQNKNTISPFSMMLCHTVCLTLTPVCFV